RARAQRNRAVRRRAGPDDGPLPPPRSRVESRHGRERAEGGLPAATRGECLPRHREDDRGDQRPRPGAGGARRGRRDGDAAEGFVTDRLTLEELAERSGVSLESLRDWRASGLIGRAEDATVEAGEVQRARFIRRLLRRGVTVEALAEAERAGYFLGRALDSL